MKELFFLEDRICGRCGPRKVAWDLQALRDSGISSIICMGDETATTAEIEKFGYAFFNANLPGSTPPTEEDEAYCRGMLPKAYQFLLDRLSSDQGKVLIHCFGGIDRTSFLMVYYLSKSFGLSFDDALAKVKTVRPNALTAIGWEDLARRVVEAA